MRSLRLRAHSAGARARALLGVVSAAALAAACTPSQPGAPAPRATRAPIQLSDPDIHGIAALLRLEDQRELDTAAIAAYARSATPEVRRRAYLAAGRIGGPGGVPILRAGLHDSVPPVRAAAAFGLGLLRETASVRLLSAVAMFDSSVGAGEAVAAVGRMTGTQARSSIARVLALGREPARSFGARVYTASGKPPAPRPPEVIARALLAVWRFPRDTAVTAVVLPFAASPDTALRWRAAYALMRLGDPAAVPTLFRLLTDPYPGVRSLAARALRASVTDSANRRAEAEARLEAALQDSAPHVRINALGALASYRDALVARAVAVRLRDPDDNVASAAAQALGALRQPWAAAPLRALVQDTSARLALRAVALASLIRVDPVGGLQDAGAWTKAPAWRQRYYAASALGGAGLRLAQPLLVALARDADARVVAQALSTFPELTGDSLAPPRGLLVEALAARDPIVRAAAVSALAAKPDPADLELYLDSYGGAVADSLDDAALASVDALAALQKRGVPAARDFFVRFPRSRDYIVRRAVAEKLGNAWGPVTPVESGRDTAFYLDVVRRLIVPVLAGARAPRVRVSTDVGAPAQAGELVLELAAADAPLTVDNFLTLAGRHFFDGASWHRVVPNFVAQDGDPRGDGNGGPGWAIRDELNTLPYLRGTLGMALSGPDTGGSQFFITLAPEPHLDGTYTVIGRVIRGVTLLGEIAQGDLIRSVHR